MAILQDESLLLPWQWPEKHWRGLVNRVRAGLQLRPTSWKDGARCAIALSFDCDHETNELRDGGKSIGRLSWGQYGSQIGVPRILDLLHRHDVRATFSYRASSRRFIRTSSAVSPRKATSLECTGGYTKSRAGFPSRRNAN